MRDLSNWLESYLTYTENQESPEKLHFWTGLSVISTALQRRVFMDRGTFNLYPNLYIVLVAESGQVRKSSAMDIGVNLLKEAVPTAEILEDAATPEGIVKHLNRGIAVAGVNGAKPTVKYESHILLAADELANLFSYDKLRASRMSILLTRIYNCSKEYKHTTKSEAQIVLYNLYPNMLAATDPRNLKVLPEDAIGGLIGRTIFVTAQKRRKKIAWPSHGSNLRESLFIDLARISALEGPVRVEQDSRDLFEKWYDEFADRKYEDGRLDAFHERAHDTALKIAMLLSVAESNDMIVTPTHVQAGITIIEQQLPEFHKITNWSGQSTFAQNKMKFIEILRRAGGYATRKTALKQLSISVDDLLVLETALIEEGIIFRSNVNREWIYKLSPEEMGKIDG